MATGWMDRVAIDLGPFTIKWYGLAYFVGFVLGALLLRFYYFPRYRLPLNKLDALLSAVLVGVLLGGRLGYCLLYAWPRTWQDPLWLLRIWQGGMAFHGAFLGVALALVWQAYRHALPFWRLADAVALCAPVGIFLGRLANFVNGELYGRITDMPWGIVYPHVDAWPRHPSQIYEALGEGLLLGLLLLYVERRRPPAGYLSALFLLVYASLRFVLEFFRHPEYPFGAMPLGLDMGQWLSVPMFVLGIVLWRFLPARQ